MAVLPESVWLRVVLERSTPRLVIRTGDQPGTRGCPRSDAIGESRGAARSGVDIVYGMPSPDVFERAKRGELAIGGCVIEEFTPERQCLACGYEWRIRRKQSARSTDPDDEDGTAGRR